MTLATAFDAPNARVTLSVTSAPGGATAAHFERSADQVSWTDVRGGQGVPLSGSSAAIIDYEYSPGVTNYYRASYGSTSAVQYVATGTASVAVNASVTPSQPAGTAVGDLVLILASIRNAGAGSVNVPVGWTSIASTGNVRMLGRRWVLGDTMPTVTFTGGVANADTIAQAVTLRNASITPAAIAVQSNPTQLNIPYPGISVPSSPSVAVVVAAWQQSTETSHGLPTIAGYGTTNLGSTTSTTGDDAHQLWAAVFPGTPLNVPAGVVTETGSVSSVSSAMTVAFGQAAFTSADTASLTPVQTDVWLKNPLRPFLNRKVTVISIDPVTRASRSGVFDVIGRTLPVARTDLQSGRSTTLMIRAADPEEASGIDQMIAVGEVLFVQSPAGSPVPTLYAVPGGSAVQRVANTSAKRYLPLALTEVATPDLTLAAVQSTWQTVINDYGTWSALVASKATWADVLLLVGSAADVITS